MGGLACQAAHPVVATQHLHGTQVQRHLPRFAELGLVNGEHPTLEVNIFVTQRQRLGDTHAGAGDQTEQGLEDDAAQAG